MQHNNYYFRRILLAAALSTAPLAALADTCGEVPDAPEIISGDTATMEELVANSQTVKSYIADADAYLDCNEALAKSDAFKEMPVEEQKAVIDTSASLLESRNSIGDQFNAEVAAFKAANP